MSSLNDRIAAFRREFPAAADRDALAAVWERIKRWRHNRHSRLELARMSPRELRDIGLTPADGERECNKSFWVA